MSDTPTPTMPVQTENNSTVFAFVVDGEVAYLHGYSNNAEQAIAALSSDPKVVAVSWDDFQRMMPNLVPNYDGWTYLDGVFSPPVQ